MLTGGFRLLPLCLGLFACGAAAAKTLSVCVPEDSPPLSYRANGQFRGLDLRVARRLADSLSLELQVIPFESDVDLDSNLAHDVNALLSSHVCDLVSGYALVSSELGKPTRPTARVPRYPGAKPRSQRPWIKLQPLQSSIAYHSIGIGLVVRDPSRASMTLDEPGDARIGVPAGTLAGTIVATHGGGILRGQAVSLSRDDDPLALLEAKQFDATIVSFDRLDAWYLKHPNSVLRRTPYLHPLQVNIGFVGLEGATDLLSAMSDVIERAKRSGELAIWMREEGGTWLAPTQPDIRPPIELTEIFR